MLQKKSIVFFSGGLGIKYVIYKLCKNFGEENSFIDLGSVLDPFFNNWSRRTYNKNRDKILKTIEIISCPSDT